MTGDSGKVEHVDVLIVGAGISGIGGAVHLQRQRPGTSFVLLDALDSFGGTWWTHRYPGIRSDSDLFTFGYGFKPWLGPPIASADEILKYLGEVIDENDLEPHIRYHHRVDTAEWSTDERLWTVTVQDTETGEERHFATGFLWMCQGYYRHNTGYTPEWPGFTGPGRGVRAPARDAARRPAGSGARQRAVAGLLAVRGPARDRPGRRAPGRADRRRGGVHRGGPPRRASRRWSTDAWRRRGSPPPASRLTAAPQLHSRQ